MSNERQAPSERDGSNLEIMRADPLSDPFQRVAYVGVVFCRAIIEGQ